MERWEDGLGELLQNFIDINIRIFCGEYLWRFEQVAVTVAVDSYTPRKLFYLRTEACSDRRRRSTTCQNLEQVAVTDTVTV